MTTEELDKGIGELLERTATLAHLRLYIDGVKDLSQLPDHAAATSVIQTVVDGIVESLEKLYRSIEDGDHRSAMPRKAWIGSRGTIVLSSGVNLDDYPDETFFVGMAVPGADGWEVVE